MSEAPKPRWATTEVTDNGKTHYGSGMPGSLCGCHSPTRKEHSTPVGVDCPECVKELRKRP
jgi:hypothetical protein